MRTALLLALTPLAAHAGAVDLTHQGRLLDASGAALSGTRDLTFRLWADETSTAAGDLLSEHPVAGVSLADGYYSVVLAGVDTADLAGDAWIGVTVGTGVELSPRQPLTTVPRAAALVGGATVGGALVLGHEPGTTCTQVGAIQYDPVLLQLEACDGSLWVPVGGRRVVLDASGARRWSDGTFASSCEAYVRPPLGYEYLGAVGDGVYLLDPDGNGAGAFPAWCDQTTAGGGWTLALRAQGSASTFTFWSPYWEGTGTLNAANPAPDVDLDAKYPAFNEVVGDEIRGCLRNASTGAYGCKTYTLPAATALRPLFATSIKGSELNGALMFTESSAQKQEWLTIQGRSLANANTTVVYMGTGINVDDHLSCYHARVRFGLVLNGQTNINTGDDAAGFGASGYWQDNCGATESGWKVGAGMVGAGNLYPTRGTLWIR